MSRNKDYQRLLNSKRWKQLRMWKLQQNPLCELCQAEGFVRSAIDVHHKIPVESARTPQEMEQLCFNPLNLQALCISCHAKIHREAKSHTKEAHQQREDERLARWKARHSERNTESTEQREQRHMPRMMTMPSREGDGQRQSHSSISEREVTRPEVKAKHSM